MLICICTLINCLTFSLFAADDWMPDPTLRQIVRERLGISPGVPMSQRDMLLLTGLVIYTENDIENIQGIERAVNLGFLHIGNGKIRDLAPLAKLQKLEVLKLHGNRISDISPLSELTRLRILGLEGNFISDITPLSNLTALEHLDLRSNQIADFTPLRNLTNLTYLDIRYNKGSGAGQFVSADPKIIDALRVAVCDFQRPEYVRSVRERIAGRDYPSVVSSQAGIMNVTHYVKHVESIKDFPRVDLSFGVHPFGSLGKLSFSESPFGGFARIGNVEALKQRHAEVLRENPNLIFLVEISYYDGRGFGFTEDSPYWLRNSDGTIAQRVWYRDAQGNESTEPLVNFTHPEVREMIIAQAVAVAKCGLYDGIWLDRWHETTDFVDVNQGLVTHAAELQARDKILQGIRAEVPDDFLILVNATWSKIPRWASSVNGVLIETWAPPNPNFIEAVGEDYRHQDYYNYEQALLWNEAHLREPNFTLLYAKYPSYADPQSPKSRQTMRTFTTLSLTHSDGYVGGSQVAYGGSWDDFWEADLGRPVSEKKQLYENRDGLFIREFTNGWAVYNRSGKEQRIQLPEEVSGWASGIENRYWHTIPDLDGEIYLKKNHIPADVNRDGGVNILDLVIVANGIGKTEPDVNSDGIVNVLDLVLVAQEIGQ